MHCFSQVTLPTFRSRRRARSRNRTAWHRFEPSHMRFGKAPGGRWTVSKILFDSENPSLAGATSAM